MAKHKRLRLYGYNVIKLHAHVYQCALPHCIFMVCSVYKRHCVLLCVWYQVRGGKRWESILNIVHVQTGRVYFRGGQVVLSPPPPAFGFPIFNIFLPPLKFDILRLPPLEQNSEIRCYLRRS